ncbi:Aste57867_9230 [Aphanomyces stellatus]|uniref:Aste57867_9230 protein n=1 Tax=Aphanomyces stellatus TaxID=120398 RepID=A0A485KMJ5_9STRA|nr:hypothetical protein As57867_009194 [Aphanomyces stellatus]VFT86113.1 Aste57867_9230 [Aphanomyces stellatus]
MTNIGYVWCILACFGAVPALAAVFWRLRIPEAPGSRPTCLESARQAGAMPTNSWMAVSFLAQITVNLATTKNIPRCVSTHFSQWANLKVLIGCAACWCFLDIGYYSTLLNTPVVLSILGYTTKDNQKVFYGLWDRAVGTALINLAGMVSGYWFSVFFV